MPNVTIFAPASHLEKDAGAFDGFICECTDLCTGVLKAERDKVHIIFVPSLEPFIGQDAYIEIKFRASAHRSSPVMDDFMKRLDTAFAGAFGRTTRIRCFAYGSEDIFARN